VSLLCGLVGLIVGFLVGFYVAMFCGANMHDTVPGIVGGGFGIFGAAFSFMVANKRLRKHVG
jgi:hypothetical protein